MTLLPDDSSRPFPSITSIVMDRATSTATILSSDRKETFPMLPSPFEPSSAIVRLTYIPSDNRLHLKTDRGDTIIAELPTLHNPAPRGGRPVVYLDQKDWSLLANVIYDPGKVGSHVEGEAAERLIALARETKVILPMSQAHMGETSQWTNAERRYRLALTVAQLSRGWQMRHPLDIRRYELRQSIASRMQLDPLPPLDVITLEGCAAQLKSFSRRHDRSHARLPARTAHAIDALTCISSYFGAMLDAEAVLKNPVPGWASENQSFTDWLAGEAKTPAQKRKSTGARFFADLQLELVQAARESGITASEINTWLDTIFDDIRAMRSLGLFSEVYQDKHLNQRAPWHSNDLTDLMYLTCAAGYADYVVGERSLVSYVNQATRRLGKPTNIYPRVSDLLVGLKLVNP